MRTIYLQTCALSCATVYLFMLNFVCVCVHLCVRVSGVVCCSLCAEGERRDSGASTDAAAM